MRLFELTNAPNELLYHWTDSNSLHLMATNEIVYAETSHYIGADDLSGETNPDEMWSSAHGKIRAKGGKKINGVSLTRNPWLNLKATWAESGNKQWRIGFNKGRLKSDYRIVPYRDWYLRMFPKQISYYEKRIGKRVLPDESEEFLFGDIKPFWHYVDQIGIEITEFDKLVSEKNHTIMFWLYGLIDHDTYFKLFKDKPTNVGKIPRHVQFMIIDRNAKKSYLIHQYLNANLVDYDHTHYPRSKRSDKNHWWNNKRNYNQMRLYDIQYVNDMKKER